MIKRDRVTEKKSIKDKMSKGEEEKARTTRHCEK